MNNISNDNHKVVVGLSDAYYYDTRINKSRLYFIYFIHFWAADIERE